MGTIVPAAILLATAGLVLTTLVRMLSVVLVHQADRAAENGSYSGVEMWHFIALICQGLRIAIPAGLLLVISPDAIQKALAAIPPVISG
ncbi:PTS sugar transporter subunit IIC, partial [Mycobacterium kansasii]